MGRIIISENVSLDGVVQDPTGEEGFRHGGWFLQIGPRDREAWAKVVLDEQVGSEAILLGRRSYEFFAARWPSREGALADSLNSMPDLAAWMERSRLNAARGIGDHLTDPR
jgi:dihydrofolate reductase